MNTNRIIIALDGMDKSAALAMAKLLSPAVWGFKANDLLIDCGLSIISELKWFGHVFADPKLHDIPNTVANSVRKLSAAGADLITVHASGGRAMIKAAVEAKGESRILAVTALTSLTVDDTQEIYRRPPKYTVLDFSNIAAESSVDGIVCSAQELTLFEGYPNLVPLIKVVPGIRPAWYEAADDQNRKSTPQVALENGATYLVIGRPVIRDSDPYQAAMRVNQEIADFKLDDN